MNVFEFILSNKKSGQFTNYGSLTSWIGCDNPRHVADYFIEIDKYFIENDMPPFSTLIINQSINMPGDGYFNYHFPSIWHQFELKKDEEILLKCWIEQVKKFNIKKAEKLLNKFFINLLRTSSL